MAKLTAEQLKRIMPTLTPRRIESALPILNKVMFDYDITNERRVAAFLATIAAESGELKYQEEIASGDDYDTRTDLGNTPERDGDGRLYKGHGRIQITGKTNHRSYTNYLKKNGHLPFVDFVKEPKRLAQEPYATDAAGWFFAVYKKLNKPADEGDFLTTQIKVNGRNAKTGLPNHYQTRQRYYARALSVLPNDFKLTLEDSAAATSSPANLSSGNPTQQEKEQAGEVGETNQDSLSDASNTQSPETNQTEPQTLTKERPSTFVKIGTMVTGAIGTVTAFGVNVGAVVQSKLEQITAAHIFFLVLGLGFVALAIWFYDRSAKRANLLNQQKIAAAQNPKLNTVELVMNPTVKV